MRIHLGARGLGEGALRVSDAQLGQIERQLAQRRARRGAEWRVSQRRDPLGGTAQDRQVARVERHGIEEIATRRDPGAVGRAHFQVRQIEVARLQEVRLDLLSCMARRHFAFEGLDHDAERLQLFLVALELATHRLAGLIVAPEPVGLVVVHLAQDLLARDRICPVEEEGEEVEPALGLGHDLIPGSPARPHPLAPSPCGRGGTHAVPPLRNGEGDRG